MTQKTKSIFNYCLETTEKLPTGHFEIRIYDVFHNRKFVRAKRNKYSKQKKKQGSVPTFLRRIFALRKRIHLVENGLKQAKFLEHIRQPEVDRPDIAVLGSQ